MRRRTSESNVGGEKASDSKFARGSKAQQRKLPSA